MPPKDSHHSCKHKAILYHNPPFVADPLPGCSVGVLACKTDYYPPTTSAVEEQTPTTLQTHLGLSCLWGAYSEQAILPSALTWLQGRLPSSTIIEPFLRTMRFTSTILQGSRL
jgi:hypothetical protein